MRVVLDTNILCSALLTPRGLTDRLYRAWREGRFEPLTSLEQLAEFRRVTRYPRLRPFIEPAAAGAMHDELRRLARSRRQFFAGDGAGRGGRRTRHRREKAAFAQANGRRRTPQKAQDVSVVEESRTAWHFIRSSRPLRTRF